MGGGGKPYEDQFSRTGNIYTREEKDREQIITFKNVKYPHVDNWLANVSLRIDLGMITLDCSL